MLDSGLTWDYAQAVLHNEMLRMVMKAVEGFTISDEAIAFDVIKEVGHGGEFITHAHTFKNMRQLSQGDLFDRKSRDGWIADGSKDVVEKAYARAAHIIDNHKVKALPETIQTQLNTIFEEAEAKAKEKRAKAAEK
jgi:trimethylamine--corrinoid protein Co-methyltransferase